MFAAGFVLALAGGAACVAQWIVRPWKEQLMTSLSLPGNSFDIVYQPLMDISGMGFLLMLGGLVLGAVSAVLWLVIGAVRRKRDRALSRTGS